MPIIRVDNDVYAWLKSKAIPFEDSPNSVLRRLARIDANNKMVKEKKKSVDKGNEMITNVKAGRQRIRGKFLCELWNVDVKHALYHHDGTFFENLRGFPGALFDYNGYVIFKTEQEYKNSSYLNIGQKLNVIYGISSIPGYKKMRK
jgi:hypothetical protein